MSTVESFADPVRFDEPTCIDDLSPREKIEYFIKGMQDNCIDLTKFRAAQETSAHVRQYKGEIWNAYNALALVLSSILSEEQAEETIRRYQERAKKNPTVILSLVQ